MKVIKVTLSTKKVVLLREMKISDQETAAQEVSHRADGDANLMGLFMQKALVKNLIVQIDGVEVPAAKREDLDSLFSMGEYSQLLKVIKELMGGDEAGKLPGIEHVVSGDK